MASPNTRRNKDAGVLNDLYTTPIGSLELAYENLVFPPEAKYLDCCDGLGAISSFLKDKGVDVKTNELFRETYGTTQDYNKDFLKTGIFNGKFDVVIANPPFKEALQFILKGLEVAPVMYVFSRLSLLEGKARYRDLYDKGWLKEVWVHTGRVGCSKGLLEESGAITLLKPENSVAYVWLVFDRNNKDECKLRWV